MREILSLEVCGVTREKMKLVYCIFILFAGCCCSEGTVEKCTAPTATGHSRSLVSENEWDHFIFVQQYPNGICFSPQHQGFGSKCSFSNISIWTLHGLWPTLQDTKSPNYCNQSAVFDSTLIQDLVPTLRIKWPNLFNYTAPDQFWCHEWCKHGTCTTMTQHTFFKTVLDYYDNGMQFGSILKMQGIVPSTKTLYSTKDIMDAFKEGLGAYPYYVHCDNRGKYNVLIEIGICLNKNTMKVMECPSATDTYGCSNNSIYYLPSSSSASLSTDLGHQ